MTWMQTASGIEFNLVNPNVAMVDFDDMAEHLAKIARFAGATPGVFYSVAQHSCLAADAVLAQTNNLDLAGKTLLHDGHEAYIVDRITPEKWAEQEVAREHFGHDAAIIAGEVPKLLRHRIDVAIYEAAGFNFPLFSEDQLIIKNIDLVMLRTEKRDLMRASGEWPILAGINALGDMIKPWDWQVAMRAFQRRAKDMLPIFREQCSSVTDERSNPRLALVNHLKGKTPSAFDDAMAIVDERDKEIAAYKPEQGEVVIAGRRRQHNRRSLGEDLGLAHGKTSHTHSGTSE